MRDRAGSACGRRTYGGRGGRGSRGKRRARRGQESAQSAGWAQAARAQAEEAGVRGVREELLWDKRHIHTAFGWVTTNLGGRAGLPARIMPTCCTKLWFCAA